MLCQRLCRDTIIRILSIIFLLLSRFFSTGKPLAVDGFCLVYFRKMILNRQINCRTFNKATYGNAHNIRNYTFYAILCALHNA